MFNSRGPSKSLVKQEFIKELKKESMIELPLHIQNKLKILSLNGYPEVNRLKMIENSINETIDNIEPSKDEYEECFMGDYNDWNNFSRDKCKGEIINKLTEKIDNNLKVLEKRKISRELKLISRQKGLPIEVENHIKNLLIN